MFEIQEHHYSTSHDPLLLLNLPGRIGAVIQAETRLRDGMDSTGR
jgi:hypothetical protein